MNVAHLKAGSIFNKTAFAQCRKSALMRNFAKRVGLIHKLAQLTAGEKFHYRRGYHFWINQIVRHNLFGIAQRRKFISDGLLHFYKAQVELVCQKLADGANTAVTEVVAIVDMSLSVFDLYQIFCRFYNVFVGQNRYILRYFKR